jgi:integrase
MAGRQAKVITPRMLVRMLAYARRSHQPKRDRVIVLLAAKAGLRACEIARLEWPMVLDAEGQVGRLLCLYDRAAKRRAGRIIPIHPELRRSLVSLQATADAVGPVIRSARGGAMQANSIVNWFVSLFAALGVEGCSSHSGRRTFITAAARKLHLTGASLRDVQLLAGHRSIETTQGYIDGDAQAQHRLVRLI